MRPVLIEEDGLGGSFVRVVEVVEADADETETLRGVEAHALAERQGDAGELVTGGDGLGRGELNE